MSHPPPPIMIDPLSLVSLLLQTTCNGLPLGRAATGFIVSKDGKHYLITNWHVLAGRHPVTNKPLHHSAAVPGELIVAHPRTVVQDGQPPAGLRPLHQTLAHTAGKPPCAGHC